MSRRDWKLFLEDILESIELIEGYVANMSPDDFKWDRKTIDAVVRNLEIIGEASKDRHPEIDWTGILGLRNRIAHEYFGLNLSIIWEIIKKELPKLKVQIKQISEK